MFLSKSSSLSGHILRKLLERGFVVRSASTSNTTVHQSTPPANGAKTFQSPLSLDPEFRPPPDNELPKAKTPEMKGIHFNIREFYQNYFPNDPVEARTPTPWHMDVYYRKQYYIVGAVLGVIFGLFVSFRRILVDRARRSDWEKHHGDPLSYYDTVGPINPNVKRTVWDDHPNLPKPAGWVSKVHHGEELH